jgi:sporulation protein YlmC with PRC-barrel domain
MNKAGNFAALFAAASLAINFAAENSFAQNPGDPGKAKAPRRLQRQTLKASELVGYNVENVYAEDLGTVRDLVIDTRSGRLAYLIISKGGFAGIGAKLRAVPATAVSPATSLERTLAMDVSHDRWEKAPTFTRSQLASLGYPRQAKKLSQYYNQPWPAPASAQTNGPESSLSPTGRSGRKVGGMYLASELAGKNVMNSMDTNVGMISDVLVDLNQPGITFALLQPGTFVTSGDAGARNELFAISTSAFIPDAKDKNFVLDLTPGDFEQAPVFNSQSWTDTIPGGGSPRVFRYPTHDNGHPAQADSGSRTQN